MNEIQSLQGNDIELFALQCKIGCSIWKLGLIDSCQAVCVSKSNLTKVI